MRGSSGWGPAASQPCSAPVAIQAFIAATQAWVLQHGEFSDALFSWGGTCMWIGATDAVQEGHWLWESGGALAWSDWAPGEPNQMGNEDCALMCSSLWSGATPGQWIDVGCAMSVPFCCDNGVNTPQSTATYFLSEARSMTRDEAEQSCEAAHGELATVRNSAENEAASFACGAHTCWLGLEEVGGNAATGTNQQVWQWPDGVDVFTAWAYGEPNNYAGRDEKFAIMNCCEEDASSTGTWYDAPGDWDLPRPLCMRARAFACPSGWTERQGSCYKIEPTQRTRDECLAACAPGGLACVNDDDENAFLMALAAEGGGGSFAGFLIGLTDAATEGTWVWDAQCSSTYTHWATTEPNDYGSGEDCGALLGSDNPFGLGGEYVDGHWVDVDCELSWQCACEMAADAAAMCGVGKELVKRHRRSAIHGCCCGATEGGADETEVGDLDVVDGHRAVGGDV